jgi:hypothetical protein
MDLEVIAMQAELTQEQAIAVLTEIAERGTLAISDQARLNMVRALLADKVLCAAEPVAWATEDCRNDKSATTYDSEVAARWGVKGWPVKPLYAPADIGKEGGE